MKKRVLPFIFMLLTAALCSLMLAACNGKKSGKEALFSMQDLPNGILHCTISDNDGGMRQAPFYKDETLKIVFALEENYGVGTFKLFINGTEKALEQDGSQLKCAVTVGDELHITFTGEAKLIEYSVALKSDGSQVADEYKSQLLIAFENGTDYGLSKNEFTFAEYVELCNAGAVLSVTPLDEVFVKLYTKGYNFGMECQGEIVDKNGNASVVNGNFFENGTDYGFQYNFKFRNAVELNINPSTVSGLSLQFEEHADSVFDIFVDGAQQSYIDFSAFDGGNKPQVKLAVNSELSDEEKTAISTMLNTMNVKIQNSEIDCTVENSAIVFNIDVPYDYGTKTGDLYNSETDYRYMIKTDIVSKIIDANLTATVRTGDITVSASEEYSLELSGSIQPLSGENYDGNKYRATYMKSTVIRYMFGFNGSTPYSTVTVNGSAISDGETTNGISVSISEDIENNSTVYIISAAVTIPITSVMFA